MIAVSTSSVINQPLHLVSQYTSYPSNAPLWRMGVSGISWEQGKPLQQGDLFVVTNNHFIKPAQTTMELISFEPLEYMILQSTSEESLIAHIEWEQLGEGRTKMTISECGFGTGFPKLLYPLLKIAVRCVQKRTLKRLENILLYRTAPSYLR